MDLHNRMVADIARLQEAVEGLKTEVALLRQSLPGRTSLRLVVWFVGVAFSGVFAWLGVLTFLIVRG